MIINKTQTALQNICIFIDFNVFFLILFTNKLLMFTPVPVSMHFLHFFLYRNLSFIVDFVYCRHNFLCGSIFLYFLKNLWICFHFSIIFFIRFEGIQTIHQSILTVFHIRSFICCYINPSTNVIRILIRMILPENTCQPGYMWYCKTASTKNLHTVKHSTRDYILSGCRNFRRCTYIFSHTVCHTD